jgi:cold shock CspA family protein
VEHQTYYRGTVEEYDDRGGYGSIRPDEGQQVTGLLLVHRNSLRTRDLVLKAGDRVLFATKTVDRGLLATDVHSERISDAESITSDAEERTKGSITSYFPDRSFGFIRTADNREAFFHVSYFQDPDLEPYVGLPVEFYLVKTDKGLQAQELSADNAPVGEQQGSVERDNWLARAILARDSRRYDEAVAAYEKGMRNSPTTQLILSYAAMEKNRRRKASAMRIYEAGIRIFKDNAKLREDAGILAASIGDYRGAIRLLNEALKLSQSQHRGEKGVLLALAHTHYALETIQDLQQAITYYERARDLFGRGSTQLPDYDILALNLAKIRTQHHRGNLTVRFLRQAKFEIVRARLLEQITEGAEFVVRSDNAELSESYGLASHLIVRVMFKAQVSLTDLEDLDSSVRRWSNSGLGDDQVALVVVSSLPQELQRLLSARIEDHRRSVPAIVPLQQSEIEVSEDALAVLRESLDRWLYRRDLFAGNSPVEGRRFFGRDKPLADLRESISTVTPTGIFGLRKVGKTSLLKEGQRRASELGDVVVYMDLLRVPSDVSDCRWLYWRIATELRSEVEKLPGLRGGRWRLAGEFRDFLDIPSGFPVAIAFDADLTSLLARLRGAALNPNPRVVLLLDEVERLLPTRLGKSGFEGFFDFFGYFRGLSQENNNFVLVITGANNVLSEAAQFGGRDNPVFNYFKEIYLPLLEPDECSLMIRELGRGMGIRFDQDARDHIYNLTGGHPFFARQLCSFVAGRNRDRPLQVSRKMIESIADEYLDVRSADFEEIVERLERDFPNELAVCVNLARAGGRLPLSEVRGEPGKQFGSMIRHLTGYQIVRVSDQTVALTIQLLTRWLEKFSPGNAQQVSQTS